MSKDIDPEFDNIQWMYNYIDTNQLFPDCSLGQKDELKSLERIRIYWKNRFKEELQRIDHILKADQLLIPDFNEYRDWYVLTNDNFKCTYESELITKDFELFNFYDLEVSKEQIYNCSKYITELFKNGLTMYDANESKIQNKVTSRIIDKKSQINDILESAGLAFDDPKHIQKIIDAFISYKETGKLPDHSDKKPVQVDSNFIEPFRQLYKKEIFKRAEIGKLLTYFIQPRSSTKSEYSEVYILKLLSGRQRN